MTMTATTEFRAACTTDEAAARHKVWAATRRGEGVTLTAEETAALWRSVLDDSVSFLRVLRALDETGNLREEAVT